MVQPAAATCALPILLTCLVTALSNGDRKLQRDGAVGMSTTKERYGRALPAFAFPLDVAVFADTDLRGRSGDGVTSKECAADLRLLGDLLSAMPMLHYMAKSTYATTEDKSMVGRSPCLFFPRVQRRFVVLIARARVSYSEYVFYTFGKAYLPCFSRLIIHACLAARLRTINEANKRHWKPALISTVRPFTHQSMKQ